MHAFSELSWPQYEISVAYLRKVDEIGEDFFSKSSPTSQGSPNSSCEFQVVKY